MNEERKSKRNAGKAWRGILIGLLVISISINAWVFLCNPCDDSGTINIIAWFNSLSKKDKSTALQVDSTIISSGTTEEPEDTLSAYIETGSEESISEENSITQAGTDHSSHLKEQDNTDQLETLINIPPSPVPDSTQLAVLNGSDSTYYIITGVFCKPQNVQRFFHSMLEKGYPAELLFYNPNLSCKRVSVGKFKSKQKAEEYLETVRLSQNPQAWLLTQRY